MVQIKLFVVSASCTPLLVPCRVVLLPIQLPANVPEKIAKDSPSAWPSDTHVGDPVGILGSCFWPGSVLAVVAYWGSNRGWEMCVCACVCVCLSTPSLYKVELYLQPCVCHSAATVFLNATTPFHELMLYHIAYPSMKYSESLSIILLIQILFCIFS